MNKKELEKLYEDGRFYKVYQIAIKAIELKWVVAGYVTDLNKLEQENKKLKEQLKEKLKLPKKKNTRGCLLTTKELNWRRAYNQAIEDTKKLNGLK